MTAMNQLPPDLVEDQYIESASKTPTVLDKNGQLLKYNVECTRGNVLYECKYGPCSNLEQHVSLISYCNMCFFIVLLTKVYYIYKNALI